jgi:CRP-like cAMP-binding protein
MADRSRQGRGKLARALGSRAWSALRKSRIRKDLAACEALEASAPADPQGCIRVAALHARLGEKEEEMAALCRAVERFAAAGALLQGIAISKRILARDPQRTAALQPLRGLHATKELTLASPAPNPDALPASGPPLRPGSLCELLQDEATAAPGAEPPGVRTLPLGDDPAPTAGPADVPLFGALGPASFVRLVRAVRRIRLREDSVLFRQGDPADALYFVADGALLPSIDAPAPRTLAALRPGDVFGELALVSDGPRTATVRALRDTTLLELDQDAVRALLREEPGLAALFLRFLRDRLAEQLLATSPLFGSIDTERLRALAASFRLREVEDGAGLLAADAPVAQLLLCVCGRFEAEAGKGGQPDTRAWLGAGQVLGESARAPPHATGD